MWFIFDMCKSGPALPAMFGFNLCWFGDAKIYIYIYIFTFRHCCKPQLFMNIQTITMSMTLNLGVGADFQPIPQCIAHVM